MSWLIRIHNADVFLNGKQVLNSIDWTMKKKENWAAVGVNGAGKTSFMKLIFYWIAIFLLDEWGEWILL